MLKYAEITAEQADDLWRLQIPFYILYHGAGDDWSAWEYGPRGCLWKPSEYPNDRFRVEVE